VKGETTERRAYEAYAATAARPYARSSFDVMLRSRTLRQAQEHAERTPTSDQSPDHVRGRRPVENKHAAPVKPSNVLTLTGESVSLSVNRGALIARRDAMTLVYEPRAVKPSAIVLTGWGGVLTLAALRFCAKYKIAVVILDWDGDFMTAMALPARRAARVARAQLEAISPGRALTMAKALIAAKISAHMHLGAVAQSKAETAIERAPGIARWRLSSRRRNDSGDRQTPASGLLRGLGDGAGEDRMADGGLPTVLALAKAGVRSET
jgi:hypothetical protein